MDDIRKNILHEQEIRKARLSSHFYKSFSSNDSEYVDEVNKENERQSVIKAIEIDNIDDAIDILKSAGTEDLFEGDETWNEN